ncbi:hypothetical protein E2562_014696 [Oryza meyeriana var. granulata]|uniref:Uncharacterized protein n=1 Tax=Oryza meyeriana var. granulata TaxID=110450 RepID=A0A6G1D2J0_9ORYZ|nr:hypothetical protein E2562_014696 [Oryza meyeriana var. granulata]
MDQQRRIPRCKKPEHIQIKNPRDTRNSRATGGGGTARALPGILPGKKASTGHAGLGSGARGQWRWQRY